MTLFFINLALFGACSGDKVQTEGMNPGECDDGADNDGDGDFDCQDSDCAGAPVCSEGEDTGETGRCQGVAPEQSGSRSDSRAVGR